MNAPVVHGRFDSGGQSVEQLLVTRLIAGVDWSAAAAELLIGNLSNAPQTPQVKEFGDVAIEWAIANRNLAGALRTAEAELIAALTAQDGAALFAILDRITPQAGWAALAEAKAESFRRRMTEPPAPSNDAA